MKVKGNRIEIGDWFIYVRPKGRDDLSFHVSHKKQFISWNFDTLEEAWEKVNERV